MENQQSTLVKIIKGQNVDTSVQRKEITIHTGILLHGRFVSAEICYSKLSSWIRRPDLSPLPLGGVSKLTGIGEGKDLFATVAVLITKVNLVLRYTLRRDKLLLMVNFINFAVRCKKKGSCHKAPWEDL